MPLDPTSPPRFRLRRYGPERWLIEQHRGNQPDRDRWEAIKYPGRIDLAAASLIDLFIRPGRFTTPSVETPEEVAAALDALVRAVEEATERVVAEIRQNDGFISR